MAALFLSQSSLSSDGMCPPLGPGGHLERLDGGQAHLPVPAGHPRPGEDLAVPARRAGPHAAVQVPGAGAARPQPEF